MKNFNHPDQFVNRHIGPDRTRDRGDAPHNWSKYY